MGGAEPVKLLNCLERPLLRSQAVTLLLDERDEGSFDGIVGIFPNPHAFCICTASNFRHDAAEGLVGDRLPVVEVWD